MLGMWVTIAVYIVALVVVAVLGSRSSKSVADLTVGGRQAGAWLSALSYGTAYFSAVMFVGYAGSAGYSFGLWGVLAGLGNMVFGSLLAWMVLARRTRAIAAEYNLHTMPEFLEKRYNSKAMRLFSCIVIFVFLIPYSASVYKGLGSLASILLGIDDTIFMIIIAVVAALLLLLGGYLVQARADFVQGIIMIFGVAMLIFFVVRTQTVGGVDGIIEYAKTAEGLPKLSGKEWWALSSLVLMTSFGTWGLPHMIQKFFGIRSNAQAKRGIVISTFFALLVAGGGYFIGSLCHLFFSKADFGTMQSTFGKTFKDYIVPTMLEKAQISSVLLGVVIVLLLAASISTLCSVTLTASSTIVLDFWKVVHPKTSDQKLKRSTKLVCLVFVLISYFVANSQTPILDLMSYSWGIISSSFLAPYLLSLYYKKTNKTGAWSSALTGFTIALVPAVCKILDVAGLANDTICTLAGYGTQFAVTAMCISLAVCFTVSTITSKRSEQKIA
ncbi:MAG: sodium:solute symporter family protein [Oscillospiraceae bacterium]|jgi:SSS family solute:Na+ symporter/sodium/proline symporter|nr:sodium:solute symporter family protein [Oscillospiraceae bacterium]